MATFLSVNCWALNCRLLIKPAFSESHLLQPYRAWGYLYNAILLVLFSLALFIGFAYSDHQGLIIIIAAAAAISCPIFQIFKRL